MEVLTPTVIVIGLIVLQFATLAWLYRTREMLHAIEDLVASSTPVCYLCQRSRHDLIHRGFDINQNHRPPGEWNPDELYPHTYMPARLVYIPDPDVARLQSSQKGDLR